MVKTASMHTPDTEEAVHATIQKIMGRSEFPGHLQRQRLLGLLRHPVAVTAR